VEESLENIIQQHLDLKRKNSHLEETLPLSDYEGDTGVFDGEASAPRPGRSTGKNERARQSTRDSFLESLEDVADFDWGDKRGS
jgi:hypothetical protein